MKKKNNNNMSMMDMGVRKYFLLIICLLVTVYSNAQSIEEARIEKAQLSLNNLVQLLQNKDLEYVDQFLSKRGWKLYSTDNKVVSWSFDRNENNNLAKGWFYFYMYANSDNVIAYSFVNEQQLTKLRSELTSSGYKKIQATDVTDRGLESVYRNSLYEVKFIKQLKKTAESGADIDYVFFIYNYKQEEERLAREETEKKETYQRAIKRAENEYYQKQHTASNPTYQQSTTTQTNVSLFKRNTAQGGGTGSGSGTGTGGNAGSGVGNAVGDFYLDGRPVESKAFPKVKNNLEGTVKVDFRADREGYVVYAKAGGRGTTINDPQVWEECEKAAMRSKFKGKPDAQVEEK
jgi:hypothetical protein